MTGRFDDIKEQFEQGREEVQRKIDMARIKKENSDALAGTIKNFFGQPDYDDKKVVKALKEEGIDVELHTVANKRRAMGLKKYKGDKNQKPEAPVKGGRNTEGDLEEGAKLVTLDEMEIAIQNLNDMFYDFVKSEKLRKQKLIEQL